MWNRPNRLGPFAQIISSVIGISAIIAWFYTNSWIPGSVLLILIIYFAVFVIYLSLPWESWEWTAETDQKTRKLKNLFKIVHGLVVLGIFLSPLICIGAAFTAKYFPGEADESLGDLIEKIDKTGALTNQIATATFITTNTAITTNSLVGIARQHNFIILPTSSLVEYALKSLPFTMVKFAGAIFVLIGVFIIGLLWFEKFTAILNTKTTENNRN